MGFATQKTPEITIKSIVLDTIKKIMELTASEFRGGYVERRFTGDSFQDIYIPDTRKQVIQMIEYLCSLVKPKFDKDMKAQLDSINKEQEQNYKDNANSNTELYTTTKLKLKRKLFDEINEFFERANYFKAEFYSEDLEEDNE